MGSSKAAFRPGVPYRIRQLVGPWINRLARALGQPEYRIRRSEYAGTVHLPMCEFETSLRSNGFSWAPFSWYHRPPVGTSPDGSWTYRSSPLADRQLHVVLCARSPGRIDVYAHEEHNWLRHPIRHVEQEGIDREEGAAEMRRWLDAQGLDFEYESRVRRRGVRLVRRLRERLLDRLGRGR